MILDKLKQIFKGRDDDGENVASNTIDENKEALNENVVYPEDVSGENNAEVGASEDIGVSNDDVDNSDDLDSEDVGAEESIQDVEENGEDIENEDFNLLNAKDDVVNDDDEPSDKTPEPVSSEPHVDYDKEIEELLKQDSATEVEDVDYEYINDISVYDTLRNEKEDILKELDEELNGDSEVEQQEERGGSNVLYIVLIAVITAIIVSIISFVIIISSAYSKSKPDKKEGKNVISNASYKSNKANFTYVSQKAEIDGQEIKLSKILVDSKATLFYFDNKFDIQKYNIILSDNNSNVYGMDLSFVQNMSQSKEDESNTILRFEPLSQNVKSINLSFYSPETNSHIEFPFEFDSPIQPTDVKYVYGGSSDNGKDVKVTVDNAVFSSAGSIINYTIKSSGSGYVVVQDSSKNDDCVILEEDASNIKKMKKYPSLYQFNNGSIILGRMDFDSVSNLNSKVYLDFKNLFKRYTINRDFNASSIYGTTNQDAVSFEVGNYKVFIEGIAQYNDKIVLVYHAENKNVKYDKNNPNANRVEVRLDAQIVSSTASGMEVILEGTSQSADYGTDMIFPVSESNRSLVYSLGSSSLKVRVNAVLIKTDDVQLEYDLSKAETIENKDREKATTDIVDIFKGRLAYKSGEKILKSVTGFSEQLMKDGSIFSEYTPETITEKAQYSAQVISSSLEGDKCYAVVQEVWKGVNGMKQTHFYRTHKIVAQKGDYFWTIVEDNVIK